MLAFFKPTFKKLLLTLLIAGTAAFYADINTSIKKYTKEQAAKAYVGNAYASALEKVYKEYSCEASIKSKEIPLALAESNTDKMILTIKTMQILNTILLALFSYLIACVAIKISNRENAI